MRFQTPDAWSPTQEQAVEDTNPDLRPPELVLTLESAYEVLQADDALQAEVDHFALRANLKAWWALLKRALAIKRVMDDAKAQQGRAKIRTKWSSRMKEKAIDGKENSYTQANKYGRLAELIIEYPTL